MNPTVKNGQKTKPYTHSTQKGILIASMLFDISRPIHNKMVIYPNNPAVRIRRVQEAGENKNALSEILMGTHTGTHIDTKQHIYTGADGSEAYPLETLIGIAEVVEVSPDVHVITSEHIPNRPFERILFKTANSDQNIDEFSDDFVALNESAAQELVSRKVRLVGLDALSIKKRGVKDRVHEILLDANIVIVEGLWLKDVMSGSYMLYCLPLPLFHTDGVPVRAVLDSI